MSQTSLLSVSRIDGDLEEYLTTQGHVFRTFGGYESGCMGYGLETNGQRWFIKHAWHPRAEAGLRRALSIHTAVQHPTLTPLRNSFEAASGLVLVYDWAHGQLLRDAGAGQRFRQLPLQQAVAAVDAVFDLHVSLAERGFIAVDLYDGAFIYDFDAAQMHVFDLDEYRLGPFTLDMERLPGSTRFMAPEEYTRGSTIDQITTVFVLGRVAAILLGDHAGRKKHWRCGETLWGVIDRATQNDRAKRFGSVREFVAAWRCRRRAVRKPSSRVKPYLAIFAARFRMLLQYRAAAFAGFATQLFWGGIRMMIFQAFYENATAGVPMTERQVTAYVWLGQAFLLLIPFRPDPELSQMIRTGNIAYEFLRPVDFYAFWLARAIASRVAMAALRGAPMLVLAFAMGWLIWPGWAGAGAFAVFMAGAVLLGAALWLLMTLTTFWTIASEGLTCLLGGATFFFSGMIVPLPLMPDWCQGVLNFLPFRILCDVPFRLFTGNIPASDLPGLLIHQWTWIVAVVLLGRWVLGRGQRRLVIQGG